MAETQAAAMEPPKTDGPSEEELDKFYADLNRARQVRP